MPSLAKARRLLSQALALLTILFLFAFILLLSAYVAWPYVSNKLWPTSAYYELHSVEVSDAKLGEPVPLRAFRDIRKPFLGSYITSVREVGHSTPICNGGADSTYRPSPERVLNKTLEYWTEGAMPDCTASLYPGKFILSTCIKIATGFSGDRVVCKESNVFTITP